MRITEDGIEMIKYFEGYRDKAYKCSAGVWTIGYGHTSGVKEGDKCTKERADLWLKQDLAAAEALVAWANYKNYPDMTQGQYDALVSFTFNCGPNNFKKLTDGGKRSLKEISAKIPAYNKAAGKVVPGLVRRRKREKELFDGLYGI